MKDASNDPQAHCNLPGVPRAVYTPFPWEVVQKPGLVVFLYEYPHGIRIVHTDGSHQHPTGRDVLNTWMGDSVGHWDGDTLVVDANGFNDQTWLDMSGNFHSDQLHIVERYTLVDAKTIQYEATLDDSKVYTKPWKMKFLIRAQKDKTLWNSNAWKASATSSTTSNKRSTQQQVKPNHMKRSEHRILTTHVGSLVRPKNSGNLAPAGQAPTDPAKYETVLSEATVDVVKKQAEIGIDIVSDGEYGKSSWSNYVLNRITGFEIRPDQLRPVDLAGPRSGALCRSHRPGDAETAHGRPHGGLRRSRSNIRIGPLFARAIANFQIGLERREVEEAFLTAVAPASTAYDGVNEYYASDKEYVFALAEALRQEYLRHL